MRDYRPYLDVLYAVAAFARLPMDLKSEELDIAIEFFAEQPGDSPFAELLQTLRHEREGRARPIARPATTSNPKKARKVGVKRSHRRSPTRGEALPVITSEIV